MAEKKNGEGLSWGFARWERWRRNASRDFGLECSGVVSSRGMVELWWFASGSLVDVYYMDYGYLFTMIMRLRGFSSPK